MIQKTFDEIMELIAEEQDRLIKEEHVHPREAWQSGLQKVAGQFGVDVDELRSELKEHLQKLRQETEPIEWETITNDWNQMALARREYWHLHREMFEAILKILFQHDPIRICIHDAGASEYSAEVNSILPRLENANSVENVHKIVYEEFVRWFGVTGERNASKYEAIDKEIWELLQEAKSS